MYKSFVRILIIAELLAVQKRVKSLEPNDEIVHVLLEPNATEWCKPDTAYLDLSWYKTGCVCMHACAQNHNLQLD